MKKYAIILIVITLISILACGLVACAEEEEEYITPIAWNKYVDEVIKIMRDNYDIGDRSVGFKTSLNTQRNLNGTINRENVEIELNFSLDAGNETDRLKIRILGETYDGENETFLLYADNKIMYLHIYEWEYDKHSYYQYDNAPIFDLFRKALSESLNMNGKVGDFVKLIADTILTDANVNRDKTKYFFDFSLKNIFNSNIIKVLESVLNLSGGSSIESILSGLGGDYPIIDVIKSISGQIIVELDGRNITNIKIKTSDESMNSLDIKEFVLKDAPINAEPYVPTNIDDYKNIKIGTVSINGTIRARDKYKVSTIVAYDYELNVSLDLIQLIANDWDFSALDEGNYFHFRLSHTCSSMCTDFCSVELGNKLMRPNGSILDIAFAPKDFGTSNLYISTSLKSFFDEKTTKQLIGSSNLASLLLSDYQLFAVSLPERRALRMATSGESYAQSSMNMLESLIAIINSLHFKLWNMDISLNELKTAMGGLFDNEIIEYIFKMLGDYGIENIAIDMGNPQYDSVRTYNIKDMAIHIATLDIADGESGIKKYNNALLSSSLRPSLEWNFNDGAYDNEEFVNNIYQGGSDSSAKIYSVDAPISPKELQHLKGGYLKYHFTDYLGDGSDKNTGFAKILEVMSADYTRIGEYQDVVLKVGYPSMNVIGLSIIASINDVFDKILYTSVTVRIKLTELIDYSAERIDIDKDSGKVIDEYNTLEFYSTTYNKLVGVCVTFNYSGGLSKEIVINGETDAVIARSSAYVVTKLGEQKLKYSICGEQHEETIKFNAPKYKKLTVVNQDSDNTYRETYKIEEPIKLSGITAEIRLDYRYDDSNKSLSLPISLFKINGVSVSKNSFEWDIIPGSTDSDSTLVFYREGIFEISADYLGETAVYEIEITSLQVGESTYQAIDKTADKPYFSGPTYAFNTEIVNKTHGSIGGDYKLELSIERGRLNNNGTLVYSKDNSSWLQTSNKVDGKEVENASDISLPAMIINPIKYNFSICFKYSGYYRIKVQLGSSLILTKDIVAKEPIGVSEYTIGTSGTGAVKINAGENVELLYKLSNRYHGNIGAELPINVKITDKSDNDITSSAYEIGTLTFNNQSVKTGEIVVLPPSIFEPYDIKLNVKFAIAGAYRVRITIGENVSWYFSITVE